jgi:hypothetical protein
MYVGRIKFWHRRDYELFSPAFAWYRKHLHMAIHRPRHAINVDALVCTIRARDMAELATDAE